MRVIAGNARGIKLKTPKGTDIRPTLDRVRESLFSILQPRIGGAGFLDLFSGTGSNGIEALSRGAAHCDFVERDSRAIRILQQNLEQTRLAARAKIWRAQLPKGLGKLRSIGRAFDIVFADPPYNYNSYNELLDRIVDGGLIRESSIVILEHTGPIRFESGAHPWDLTREEKYGKVRLSFFALK